MNKNISNFEKRVLIGLQCLPPEIQKALSEKTAHDRRMIKRLLNALGYHIEQLAVMKQDSEAYKLKHGQCSSFLFALHAATLANNLKYDSKVIALVVSEVKASGEVKNERA